jgi:hypothetical protein
MGRKSSRQPDVHLFHRLHLAEEPIKNEAEPFGSASLVQSWLSCLLVQALRANGGGCHPSSRESAAHQVGLAAIGHEVLPSAAESVRSSARCAVASDFRFRLGTILLKGGENPVSFIIDRGFATVKHLILLVDELASSTVIYALWPPADPSGGIIFFLTRPHV